MPGKVAAGTSATSARAPYTSQTVLSNERSASRKASKQSSELSRVDTLETMAFDSLWIAGLAGVLPASKDLTPRTEGREVFRKVTGLKYASLRSIQRHTLH